ncbi:DUF4402 domain-containing protein [Erythrobacter sp.]|jgi:hypothetical protein|uniref:DUF4402 domain-containing protein n=1 Tax=Erythrobacter sp. TaxID=1042 RepID=UPI002EB58E63|nr:DUF4402 domain-containing protein [Erythrobacter sp.]
MIKQLRFGAAGVAMVAAFAMSSAAQANTASADATAEVLDALTLNNVDALDFGTMVVSGAGVVTLAANGDLACDDADIVCSGTTSVATFTVDGTANTAVTINLPTAAVELRHPSYTTATATQHAIVLNTFTSNRNGGTGPEVTLDGDGDGDFAVGGTITLDGSEAAGVFSGSFDVSVEYS